jgi:hypothetical protein
VVAVESNVTIVESNETMKDGGSPSLSESETVLAVVVAILLAMLLAVIILGKTQSKRIERPG